MNCCVPPTDSEAFCGVIAIDAIGGGTLSVVLAVVLPYVAVIVVVPTAIAVAIPVVELIVAMFEELEAHVTKAVTS